MKLFSMFKQKWRKFVFRFGQKMTDMQRNI